MVYFSYSINRIKQDLVIPNIQNNYNKSETTSFSIPFKYQSCNFISKAIRIHGNTGNTKYQLFILIFYIKLFLTKRFKQS